MTDTSSRGQEGMTRQDRRSGRGRRRLVIRRRGRLLLALLGAVMLVLGIPQAILLGAGAAGVGGQGTEYVWISVQSGDTLWDLARTYGDAGTDIRRLVYRIQVLNDLQGSGLQPGMQLKIPVH